MMATQPSKRRPGRRPAEEGDAEATRHHILRHAWRLFNSQSYTSISMDEIARAAGVTKATLYYHFPGKADLLVASVQDWLTLSPELQTALVDQSYSVRQRLTMLINEWYRYDQEEYNEAIINEAVLHLSPAHTQKVVETVNGLLQPLTRLMAEGVERGELRPIEPKLLAFAFRQSVGAIDFETLGAQTKEERYALMHALLDLFLVGARA